MKSILNKFSSLIFVALAAFASCDSEDEVTKDWIASGSDGTSTATPSAGNLNISKYVSVGNSLTAGFSGGALFATGQHYSYPAMVARQLALASGGEFNNPDIISPSASDGTGRIAVNVETALTFIQTGQGSLSDALVTGTDTANLNRSTVSINNFGVPGARAVDLNIVGYGSEAGNPFYAAFASSPAATVISDAKAANGSFFTVWIGSNDVLGYALEGGVDEDALTTPAAFTAAVTNTLDELSANGAKGLILNLPPITTIPYFQIATELSRGVDLIPLARQGQADTLNAVFNVPFPSPVPGVNPGYNTLLDAAVNAGLLDAAKAARRKIVWKMGSNPPLITDESLSEVDLSVLLGAGTPAGTLVLPQIRQASNTNNQIGDLFPITALAVLGIPQEDGTIPGITAPLEDQYTLTESEQINIITALGTFNAIIDMQVAARPNVTLVDVHPLFADMNGFTPAQATGLGLSPAGIAAADDQLGKVVEGTTLFSVSFDANNLYNSVFSTDFIHPNARGYGLIANEVIHVINETYDAQIPTVSILNLPGINAPQ